MMAAAQFQGWCCFCSDVEADLCSGAGELEGSGVNPAVVLCSYLFMCNSPQAAVVGN